MEAFRAAACGTVAKTDPQDSLRYLPNWMHAQDTAGVMDNLCRRWLPRAVWERLEQELGEDTALRFCCLLALLHDIGKQTALFQTGIQMHLADYALCTLEVPRDHGFYLGYNVPHARAGEAILLKYGFPDSFAAIIGAHHGKPQDGGADIVFEESPRCFYGTNRPNAAWESCWQQTVAAALAQCGFASPDELPAVSMSAQMLLTGLLIMADWLASNTAYFSLLSTEERGAPEYYPARVDAAWDTIALTEPWESRKFGMDDALFAEEFGFLPNEVQKMVLDAVGNTVSPGIFILEAGMGSGKTEAALAAAELLAQHTNSGGLFFGLPTQATANGLFDRVRHWAEYQSADGRHGIRLAHGASALNAEYQELFRGSANISDDEEGGLLVHSWFEGRKQALLAEFVIGTVDQLLMASLQSRHLMLRHLGLAGKVVIIDEVHSYSHHMNAYLDRTLTWLGEYGAPVVVLSATLPEARRTALVQAYLQGRSHQSRHRPAEAADWQRSLSYPLLTWTDGLDVQQTAVQADTPPKTIEIGRETLENLPERLQTDLADGGCAGIIVNTVHRAQSLAARLREALPEMRVIVFHSQFAAADRARREQELLELVGKHSAPAQRDKLIVVGTQVIEQSLDLDFDVLFTDLCPMDLLLQRIGRLHRHGRVRPERLHTPRCFVMEADSDELESGAEAIYGAWLLLRTKAFLPEHITLPEDIPVLVQNVYRNPDMTALSEWEIAAWEQYDAEKQASTSKANVFLLTAPRYGRRFSTIEGILNADPGNTEVSAQKSVRGGDASIEVLVLQRGEDGCLYRLDDPETPLYADHVPAKAECREIAKQRLRLASCFSRKWRVDDVIRELEQATLALAEWQQSPWLRGEVFLLLDESGRATLNGTPLFYSREDGLCIVKEEENAGKGI